ncbi:MAG: hypothetical protein DRP35_09870 [Candidatus Zixiibacteriota bacterium]|nr:MAG: hypothetical protein DRP35_09870 [candidate division Zixibacteria bacterium]
MNGIYLVLGILLAGALLTFFANKIAGFLRDIFFLGTVLAATVLFFTNVTIGETVAFNLGGISLKWGITNFGYIFALIVLGLGVLGGIYSIPYMKGKERLGYFYMNFLLSLFSMMGILFSQDLVSFFFFWEIMTWSSYLMVIYNGNNVQKFGIKYFVFSAVGAYAMLMAIVIIQSLTGTFYLSDLFNNFAAFPHTQQILLPILLMTGFGVKAAMWPLHVWAPDAYSNAPMSYTQLFSGALSKMGVYGLIIVFVTMVSHLPENFWFREIIGWLGAITAVVGTLWALVQTDAKRLLAYSSVAQLGYIITGVAVGTELGMLAGIFLAVLHAMFKGTLFMAVGAVERQTGSTDMTVVTGLIRKMPWTFIATLISIIALAGIPPLGGFVGKWMLYESLITSNHYLMVIMIFFSSTAAFLYCYKILFGMFLGQEEPEFENVKEAPFFMVIPMLLLAVAQVFFGSFPGYLFKYIDKGLVELGYPVTEGVWWKMTTLFNGWGDKVSVNYVMYGVLAVFVFFLIIVTLRGFKHQRYVTTRDISSSGELPRPEDNWTYKLDFYKPFERAAEPFYKKKIEPIYQGFADGMEGFFDFVRRIYNGNGQTYAIYVIVFFVILLLLGKNLFGF